MHSFSPLLNWASSITRIRKRCCLHKDKQADLRRFIWTAGLPHNLKARVKDSCCFFYGLPIKHRLFKAEGAFKATVIACMVLCLLFCVYGGYVCFLTLSWTICCFPNQLRSLSAMYAHFDETLSVSIYVFLQSSLRGMRFSQAWGVISAERCHDTEPHIHSRVTLMMTLWSWCTQRMKFFFTYSAQMYFAFISIHT